MLLQRKTLVLVFLYFFSVHEFQVEGTLSSMAKTRRTQSMRPLASHKTNGNNLETHSQSGSQSSFSSASTATELHAPAVGSQPIASTSIGKQFASTSFKEVDLRPLTDNLQHTRQLSSISLHDASIATHSDGGNIDPTRHGVFARVRSTMQRYGSAVVIGAAVGVGGIEAYNHFFPGNNKTQVNNTQVISVNNKAKDLDEIYNPL